MEVYCHVSEPEVWGAPKNKKKTVFPEEILTTRWLVTRFPRTSLLLTPWEERDLGSQAAMNVKSQTVNPKFKKKSYPKNSGQCVGRSGGDLAES